MAKYSFYISDGVFISPESRFEEALKTGSDVCHEDSVVWTFGSPVPMPPEACQCMSHRSIIKVLLSTANILDIVCI